MMERIALYGGTFDPPHNGHLAIARAVTGILELAKFIFVPAFHAPHKKNKKPTSPEHRFAMLSEVAAKNPRFGVSTIELDDPEHPYTFQTIRKVRSIFSGAQIFFVIGGDSWNEITTWVEWEEVLTSVGIIVVTRPGHELVLDHVSERIRERIVDLRVQSPQELGRAVDEYGDEAIFLTDAVQLDISATDLRGMIAAGNAEWKQSVPEEVANYIEKHQIYS
jgi:nicotinate-nucleotide adenylyltransferase